MSEEEEFFWNRRRERFRRTTAVTRIFNYFALLVNPSLRFIFWNYFRKKKKIPKLILARWDLWYFSGGNREFIPGTFFVFSVLRRRKSEFLTLWRIRRRQGLFVDQPETSTISFKTLTLLSQVSLVLRNLWKFPQQTSCTIHPRQEHSRLPKPLSHLALLIDIIQFSVYLQRNKNCECSATDKRYW